EPYTVMVPVKQCAYKQVAYNVCRPVRETVWQTCRYTVQTPVRRTVMRTCTYTVCRPVRETVMKECRYTVCRPVQSTSLKTVTETCYQNVTETCYKEVCEKVCVPRSFTKQVTRECGEWVEQQYYVPGKTVCCNGQLVQCPGMYCTKKVWCPRTVVENVCCTV